jgi:AcrR family transcriptional regulator
MSVSGRGGHLPADQRRDQILDHALAVFAHKGFHETSITDICARACIARGTLYQYFPDKRGVLAALVDRIVRRVFDAIQHWPSLELTPDAESAEASYVAFVEARCRQVMEAVFADADTASLILRMARGTGFVGEALVRIEQQVVGVIAADVRAHTVWGVVRPCDPQLVAEFIVGGIEKIVLQALDEGRAIDVVRIARELAMLVSHGLRPADPDPPPRSGFPSGHH